MKIGVLVSGSGSNLQAILDGCASGFIPGQVVMVISNKAGVFALERAEKVGIAARVVDHRHFEKRDSFDQVLGDLLEEYGVELICLAGFMRVLTSGFVQRFQGRILNVHPALLPAFPGLGVQERAIRAGVRFSGATVHFVDDGVDTGPIVVQAVVPVLPDDDVGELSARILRQEHRIYPLAIRWFVQGRLRVENGRVGIMAGKGDYREESLISPPLSWA